MEQSALLDKCRLGAALHLLLAKDLDGFQYQDAIWSAIKHG